MIPRYISSVVGYNQRLFTHYAMQQPLSMGVLLILQTYTQDTDHKAQTRSPYFTSDGSE